MTQLTPTTPVRWKNPETGGWETGRIVETPSGGVVNELDGVSLTRWHADPILVALTFGGLAFVPYGELERVALRSEWEQP
jgi:hypothetical protein